MSDADFWRDLSRNHVLLAGLASWAVAQTMKVVLGGVREKRFNFKWFVGSGGMPSSHAAVVTGLSVAVGMEQGFWSTPFAVACLFALIIMFDAQGVRRQSGKQAEALNRMLDDVYAQKGIRWEPLKELFGHTPVEVIAGSLVGVVVALMFFQ